MTKDKTIIATVGTSIFSNQTRKEYNEDYINFKNIYNEGNFKEEADFSLIKSYVLSKIKNAKGFKKMSAEIKSLSKIGITKNDSIYLLSTDTNNGLLASEILKEFFQDKFNCKVYIERIEGLQVNNAKLFEKVAVKKLLEIIVEIVNNNNYSKEIIFNPTGGFKGVVPYITLAGMIYKKKITYIFENTEGLITLPPIPVEFDFNPIEDHEDKFNYLYNNQIVSKKEFFKGIEFDKRDTYYQFIESDEDNYVTFSAIGELLYNKYLSTKNKPYILIYEKVFNDLKKLNDSNKISCIKNLFKKLLDPNLRKNNLHDKPEDTITDLQIFKESNTSPRAFYYMENDIVKVCLVELDHDKYELKLKKTVYKNNFREDNFIKWDDFD
ncbi:CRISPR-associated protein [Clostridium acetireducens DSM 10703]|uniref:CRISPR-associated protein n=1 Tax=Clostridium acetireducens DSM 10703 TaxID=1121290 RepID=A0A1E8F1J5_9CLOT|nr:putative CRISPR-associated protein [Clostridium acetireducens]OFI07056.1 CRISPR-associated protein [Clostridium acetireducens DSM 10703]